jgi:hypothetical protein
MLRPELQDLEPSQVRLPSRGRGEEPEMPTVPPGGLVGHALLSAAESRVAPRGSDRPCFPPAFAERPTTGRRREATQADTGEFPATTECAPPGGRAVFARPRRKQAPSTGATRRHQPPQEAARVLRWLIEYEHLPRSPLTRETTVFLTLNLILTLILGGGV